MVSWFVSLLVVAVTSCQPVLPLYCNAALEIYNYFNVQEQYLILCSTALCILFHKCCNDPMPLLCSAFHPTIVLYNHLLFILLSFRIHNARFFFDLCGIRTQRHSKLSTSFLLNVYRITQPIPLSKLFLPSMSSR